jgi:hypothetical protein
MWSSSEPAHLLKIKDVTSKCHDFVKLSLPPILPSSILRSLGFVPGHSMQRLIARFLLLLATAGVLLPAVLQATAAPSHLCCRRMAQHQCHSYANTNPDEPAVRGPGCSQNCRRALVISHWANPQLLRTSLFRQTITITGNVFRIAIAADPLRCSLTTRAPPAYSIG